MENAETSRRQRITASQKDELVERVCSNYNVAVCRFQSTDGKRQKNNFWTALAADLNSMEGANKNVSSWQKSFYDIRNSVRAKFKDIRNHAYRTGGGEPMDVELNPLEERLLSVLPPEHVDGIDCMEGGFVSDTIPNFVQARAAVAQTEATASTSDTIVNVVQARAVLAQMDPTPSTSDTIVNVVQARAVLAQMDSTPSTSGTTSALAQEASPSTSATPDHLTYSLDFNNSVLVDINELPGPAASQTTSSTVPIPLEGTPSDGSPAHEETDLIPMSVPVSPSSINPITRRPSRARNLYRTSLSKNSQASLQLQREALKELRKSNVLKQQLLDQAKKESLENERRHMENERRHTETTSLLKELIALQRSQQNQQ